MSFLNGLKDSIIAHDIASIVATILQVLNEPKWYPTTKFYACCFRGGVEKEAAIVYQYNKKELQQFVKDWFESFSGAVHSGADFFFGVLYV